MSRREVGPSLFIQTRCTTPRPGPTSAPCYALKIWTRQKPIGQPAADLTRTFDLLPSASFCFDMGHARQVDPTMSEATAILQVCRARLKQLHVSEVNTQSKHDPLSLESMLAFQRVATLVPRDIPIIMESRVDESHIPEELGRALESLTPNPFLAMAGV